jgi:hypothetical protein
LFWLNVVVSEGNVERVQVEDVKGQEEEGGVRAEGANVAGGSEGGWQLIVVSRVVVRVVGCRQVKLGQTVQSKVG